MKRFQNILVAVDTHFDAHPALAWAEQIAQFNQAQPNQAQSGQTRLKIVEVVAELSWLVRQTMRDHEELMEALQHDKQAQLETLAAPLRETGLDVVTAVRRGKVAHQIIDEVAESNHDLVVRVSKGTRSQRTGLFGTSSMRLLRNCPCALWFVRPESSPSFDRILATVDPDPDDRERQRMNRSIMELAQSVAQYHDGELHVCHGWSLHAKTHVKSRLKEGEYAELERKAQTVVAEALDQFLSAYDLSHQSDNVHLSRSELMAGDAISTLTTQIAPDIIVIGTTGRSGVAGAVLGNTAEFVLDHVECAVLAIKPDPFIAPGSSP